MISAAVHIPPMQGHIRPVDPARDMGAIANLIEIAFGSEMDHMGSNLVADLRQMAALGPLLTFIDHVAPFVGGYVYEQDGRLVGNVTVTPEDPVLRHWFISNVAVHPDVQHHGIGRELMAASLDGIRHRGGRQVTLQVRSDNEPAQRLYRRLGFKRFDTLVELLRPRSIPAPAQPAAPLRRLGSRDWQALLDLAAAATPAEVQQVRPLRASAFRPSLSRRIEEWLESIFGGQQTWRWGIEEDRVLTAVVSTLVQSGAGPARIDLTVRPGHRGAVENELADWGLNMLVGWYPRAVAATVSTSHREALQALQSRCFVSLRTLDQLVLAL